MFNNIIIKIIKEQELIIGPLAWVIAGKIQGLQIVDSGKEEITLDESHQKDVVDSLVSQYEKLFGRASREVCRDAVRNLIAELSPSDVPLSLVA